MKTRLRRLLLAALLLTAVLLPAFSALNAQTVQATDQVWPFPAPNPTSSWDLNSSDLIVGNYDTGSLTIADGGSVSNRRGDIGYLDGGQGEVIVTGTGSTWSNSETLNVGHGGTGSLSIAAGGSVSSSYGAIGSDSGSRGEVLITGAGSTWNNNSLSVGAVGAGSLTIAAGGSVSSISSGYIGVSSGGQGEVTVTGAGSTWTNSGGLAIGGRGAGSLIIANGGFVSNSSGEIGLDSGGQGEVTVTGAGSTWNNSGSLYVGDAGTGSLIIKDGGSVSSSYGKIGFQNGANGTVTVTGAGSTWNDSGSLNVGDSSGATGTLTVEKGGTVAVGGSLKVWGGATVNVEVFGNDVVTVGGNVANDGVIRLTAAPDLAAGSYTPLSVTGTWSGVGSYQAIGGTWDFGTHLFTVSAATTAAVGETATLDLATTQRLAVTGGSGQQVMLAFDPGAEATGGGSTITFSATENTASAIGGGQVLSAWDFDTDLTDGSSVLLSFDIGSGWDAGQLSVWHSDDGLDWTLFETDIAYDGGTASFLVNGFSSYAITAAVPEPATCAALAGLGALALATLRRRRRG